jgi:hypothetical protein
MVEAQQLPDLSGFTGGGDQYHHWLRRLTYTEGVKHLADSVGAHWLIDAIASHQGRKVDAACGTMQFWELHVSPNKKALLICRPDSNEPACVRQKIAFTDFPCTEADGVNTAFRLWVENNVLMLPSEY